jgi:DNA topoisomerase-2
MVLFTETGGLKKFDSPHEIIDTFCIVRYNFYVKRKAKQLKNLEKEIKMLGNKKRFLQEVRDGEIKLFEEIKNKKQSRKTLDIVLELEEKGYDKSQDIEDEDAEESKSHGYEYLLRMQISSITAEKIERLKNDIINRENEYKNLFSTSEKDMWIHDLDVFLESYRKWLPIIDKEKLKKKKN